ncbi:MAG: hypothetical protein ABL957_15675 [Parvularculaceae bacterium]
MGALKKAVAIIGFAALAFGATAASADDRGRDGDRGGYDKGGGYDRGGYDDRQPNRCDSDHDHRGHEPRYYDYYPADRYSRAGDYRRDGDRYDDRGRYDDRSSGGRYDDRYGYGGRRVLKSRTYDTRYRARIYLTEEEFNSRNGYRRVCTLEVRGPDRRYVSHGQLRSIASRECSRRAEIRVL